MASKKKLEAVAAPLLKKKYPPVLSAWERIERLEAAVKKLSDALKVTDEELSVTSRKVTKLEKGK